ncbi:MAG: three-Cys-motif partner protein TcmP [Candidatus Anammoxibacter sp.]
MNKNYWDKYSNLQKVKHDLIKHYLQGWFPKLGNWANRILYFDTHAGRGRHSSGELGSPLVAIKTLLNHSSRDRILNGCEVIFSFIENEEDNIGFLEQEISDMGTIPNGIIVNVYSGDSFDFLNGMINKLENENKIIAPAFIFIDPFGFKIPGKLIKRLMSFEKVELFINVIWRELCMAMKQPEKMKTTLDSIFDSDNWQDTIDLTDFNDGADQVAKYFCDLANAKWFTHIKMLGGNDTIRYFLLHLTNSDDGRDLMKNCMWKVCPSGGFYARKKDDPRQGYLITPEPDLSPLKEWILCELNKSNVSWKYLIERNRSSLFLDKHLNSLIRELRNSGVIEAINCDRFALINNPTLILKK